MKRFCGHRNAQWSQWLPTIPVASHSKSLKGFRSQLIKFCLFLQFTLFLQCCWISARDTTCVTCAQRQCCVNLTEKPSQVEGITLEIMEAALRQAADGRRHILAQMGACDPPPRRELGPYTPRILIVMVRVSCRVFSSWTSVFSAPIMLRRFVRRFPKTLIRSCLQLRFRSVGRLCADTGMTRQC